MPKTQRILSLMLVIFFIAGCGESFRGSRSSESEETQFYDAQGNRRSFTDEDVDRDILVSYKDEVLGKKNEINILVDSIRGLDLIITEGENKTLDLKLRVVMSCNEAYEFNGNVTAAQLQSKRVISLTADGDYIAEVQCTASNCEEMVAAIKKRSGSNQATVLVGLGITQESQGSILFINRFVDNRPFSSRNDISYFANNKSHIQEFESDNSCSITTGEQPTFLEGLIDQGKDALFEKGIEKFGDLLRNLF